MAIRPDRDVAGFPLRHDPAETFEDRRCRDPKYPPRPTAALGLVSVKNFPGRGGSASKRKNTPEISVSGMFLQYVGELSLY